VLKAVLEQLGGTHLVTLPACRAPRYRRLEPPFGPVREVYGEEERDEDGRHRGNEKDNNTGHRGLVEVAHQELRDIRDGEEDGEELQLQSKGVGIAGLPEAIDVVDGQEEEHQRPGRVQVVQVAPGAGWEPTSALAGRDSGCQHRVEDEGGAVKGRHDAGARQHPVFWEPEVCRVDAGGAQLFKVPPVVDIEEIRPWDIRLRGRSRDIKKKNRSVLLLFLESDEG